MLDDFKNLFKGNNFIGKIIVINAIVFVLYNILAQFSPAVSSFFSNWINIPASLEKFIFRPWTILTYMFMHQGLGHIFYNMLVLFWFGRFFGDFMGQHRLRGLYFLGGFAGAGLYLLIYNLLYLAGEMDSSSIQATSMVGASAGVMAVVIATGTRFGDQQMNLLLIGPVKLRYVALFLFISSTLFNFMSNFGGNLAHIGGAFIGFMYIRQLDKGQDWALSFSDKIDSFLKLFERGPKLKVVKDNKAYQSTTSGKAKASYNSTRVSDNAEMQARTDAILDKISKSGYENLSKEEKEHLFKLSKEK